MLDENLSRYIWRHTKPQQIWILVVVAVSMIPYFLSFNLPKQIVNGPIQGDGFADPGATQPFFRLVVDLPYLGSTTIFEGVDLARTEMLFALSGVFLLLVIINGLFKFYINTYKGRLGERLLRRMRYTLVDQILRFPPHAFKRMKAAEVAGMVKDEVEPIGGFTGDAFVAPALLGGQALTALVFIFVQSIPLGMIALALVMVQAFIIPRMRRKLLVLGRERQLTARELAGRVSEIFDGMQTVHAYDTSNYERADVAARLGRIFTIRFEIYQRKFLIKFINNFLASVTPFLFYAVGGYLALNGMLDIGQLVAVIGAYKDLPGPLKELIDWDQNRQDVQIKYQTVTQQFEVEGMIDAAIQQVSADDFAGKLLGPLAVSNLEVREESGETSLANVTFQLNPGESVAVLGHAGAGGDVLAEVLARVVWARSGRVTAGTDDLRAIPESVIGRAITYAGPEPYLFFGSVRDNLLYGLKNAPTGMRSMSEFEHKERLWNQREAVRSGNPDFDIAAEWINYSSLGLTDEASLFPRLLAVLETVSLSRDILDLALRSTVDPDRFAGMAEKVVAMRKVLYAELKKQDLDGLIVPFESGAYNAEATVMENLLFGNPRAPELVGSKIGQNSYFRSILAQGGLDDKLMSMGLDIARNGIELISDLPPEHPIFQQLTFLTPEEIPVLQSLLAKLDADPGSATGAEKARLITLSFSYVEPRFRFGLLDDTLMAEVVAFREPFHSGLPESLKGGVELFDPENYLVSSGLLDNILFGRISQKYRDGASRIYTEVGKLLAPSGLYETAMAVGLDYHVGAGGKRLTAVQRQKLSLARALIRRSEYYIFNRPLSALDGRAQAEIVVRTLALLKGDGRAPGVLWVVPTPAQTTPFDRIVVFERGKLVEDGNREELLKKNGIFNDMISA
ncbi:MAG: ABC transporter ATP-binding protein [Gemmobacter sp.]|nr:ABC transporter ATP-binding protein [Gemmobacter sp.]